jgi:hypothetical protein
MKGSLLRCLQQEEESLVRGKKEEEDWKIEQDKTGARTWRRHVLVGNSRA